jgi:FMN reductase
LNINIAAENDSAERLRPFIVGLGGTMRAGSTSERALRYALTAAERSGADTAIFVGADLDLPLYNPENPERTRAANAIISALRRADGVVIATPGYDGSLSGLVKNAIDYVEDMRSDERVYFASRPVGCIVSAAGWQSVGSTLVALRSIVHALRGWPTPLGVGINSRESTSAASGLASQSAIETSLAIMAQEVVSFAEMQLAQAHKPNLFVNPAAGHTNNVALVE